MCRTLYTGSLAYLYETKKIRTGICADIKKLRYSSLLLVNVQTLRIGESDPDPYLSDDEVEYVSLDKPIKTGVLAARSNQPKPSQSPSKEPVRKYYVAALRKKMIMLHQKTYDLVNGN